MGHADTNSYFTTITSTNTDTQVFISPWLVGRSYIPHKIIVSNLGAGASIVKLYDKDLTSGTIAPAGTVSNPVFVFNLAIGETKIIDCRSLPLKRFISGMTAQSTVVNAHIIVEVKED